MTVKRKRAEAGTSTLSMGALAGAPMSKPVQGLTMRTDSTAPSDGASLCPICGTAFHPSRRSQRACGSACKQALHRSEKRNAGRPKITRQVGLPQMGRNAENRPSQVIENNDTAVTVFDDLLPSTPLLFERINDITVKITDGVKIRHTGGTHFAGSDQTRALGWLTNVGWLAGRQAWMARIGDLSVGPTSFARAREAAILMIRGGFDQPVRRTKDPIRRLNLLNALMLDGEVVS